MIADPEQRFAGLPILTEYVDGVRWRVMRDCSYRIVSGTFSGRVSTVRAGFVFDWATVPRVLWALYPPSGTASKQYGIAALWHDWVYVHQQIAGCDCTREDADALFREIMLYVGVSPFQSALLYAAVRVGGWYGWRRNKSRTDTFRKR